MKQRVGTCSRCGGDVVGYRGAWYSTAPPPRDHCTACGAVRADDVIPMAPRRGNVAGLSEDMRAHLLAQFAGYPQTGHEGVVCNRATGQAVPGDLAGAMDFPETGS